MTLERPLTQNIRSGSEPLDLRSYEKAGGFQALRKALGSMAPQDLVEAVKKSGLRGRGGAGFPTGTKWGLMPAREHAARPRYLVANADEMEPGTFKDRMLLEGDPHQLIEGMIVAGYATESDMGYIFLRGEYTTAARTMKKAIAEAYAAGYLGANILGS